jgi:hypothetical protein
LGSYTQWAAVVNLNLVRPLPTVAAYLCVPQTAEDFLTLISFTALCSFFRLFWLILDEFRRMQ